MRGLLLIAGVLVAAPAVAADQFDLICEAGKTHMRYRVDLVKGEWCATDCSYIQKIAEVSASKIALADHKSQFRGDREYYTTISRTDGEWLWYMSGVQDITGHCEPASFSGMPAPRF